ncbi:hypothetical protein NAEGRDRAFT_79006 [Naegleria gruberi]|uniref:Uncharacterized protein n=1 Tax=Naegleria gruberi TaxID=5762 RepID=D2V8J7_NAEGR|nr:uncharacterized protein NAEGRDRAFT_79006 [Naegleria gruberi]EFC46819.1 hypothetical protein NAEGRDRAFT_79006 [Naegleria gruberi]|eukprot:XP_002679563.1 hypothetical protein NAEGRDRAFT_79006 [Naegleria gruberi strain NEG-M]
MTNESNSNKPSSTIKPQQQPTSDVPPPTQEVDPSHYQKRISQLQTQLKSIEEAFNKEKLTTSNLQSNWDQEKNVAQILQHELDKVKQDLESQRKQVSILQSNLDKEKNKVNHIQEESEKHTKEVDRLRDILDTVQVDKKLVEFLKSISLEKSQNQDERIKKLTKESNEARDNEKKLKKENDDLQNREKQLVSEKDQKITELNTKKKEFTDLKKEKDTLEKNFNKLRSEHDETKQKLKTEQDSHKNTTKKLEDLRSDNKDLKNDTLELQANLQSLESKISNLEKDKNRMRTEASENQSRFEKEKEALIELKNGLESKIAQLEDNFRIVKAEHDPALEMNNFSDNTTKSIKDAYFEIKNSLGSLCEEMSENLNGDDVAQDFECEIEMELAKYLFSPAQDDNKGKSLQHRLKDKKLGYGCKPLEDSDKKKLLKSCHNEIFTSIEHVFNKFKVENPEHICRDREVSNLTSELLDKAIELYMKMFTNSKKLEFVWYKAKDNFNPYEQDARNNTTIPKIQCTVFPSLMQLQSRSIYEKAKVIVRVSKKN